jgi:hypothetical protein
MCVYAYLCRDGKAHDVYSELTLCDLTRDTDGSEVFCSTSLFLQISAGILCTILYSMEHSP